MADYSKVILVGRLTRDPELRYTAGGTAVAQLGIAVNRRVKRGDEWVKEVSFFDAVIFGRRAEACAEYMAKGRPIFIDGDLIQRRWESQDGSKRSKVEVLVNDWQFIESRSNEDGSSRSSTSQDKGIEPPPIEDDDIPF